jgi:hypothetical protein
MEIQLVSRAKYNIVIFFGVRRDGGIVAKVRRRHA